MNTPTAVERITIGAGAPVFAGHFPQFPILPGVLLIAMARAVAGRALGRSLQLRRVVRQRFMRPVLPGMEVSVECRVAGTDDEGHRVVCRWLDGDGNALARGELVLE